jgi:excisionase family DNA binding protein
MSKLLNVKEVADRIGVNWRTILRYADAGKFPWGLKVGSLRRWTIEEIQDYVEAARKKGGKS